MSKFSPVSITLLIVFVVSFVGFLLVFIFARDWLERFMADYGESALFVVVFLSDLNLFLTPDLFTMPAGAMGMSAWVVGLVAGVASTLSGILYFVLCSSMSADHFNRFIGEKHVRKGHELFKKYGMLGIFISGISPVPFNIASAFAGFYKMPLVPYVVAALVSRFLRFYLGAGVLSFFGFVF